MENQVVMVDLKHEPSKGGKVKVTAEWKGKPEHVDEIYPARKEDRKRFIKDLCEALPALVGQEEAIDRDLMSLAAPVPEAQDTHSPEVDRALVVRPEQFITPWVVGLTVPVAKFEGGRLAGHWMQYLRWADGRRECRELAPTLDLGDGRTLMFHPMPGEPSPHMLPGWSEDGRRKWLAGHPAPRPSDVFRRICERIAYHVDFAEDHAAATTAVLALWVLLSHGYVAWPAVPYLHPRGLKGSGKSTLLAVLSQMVHRPFVAVNPSTAVLFRTLHDMGGVLLLDEAETLYDGEKEGRDVNAVLLAGYCRGATVPKLESVGEKQWRAVHFEVFGPKVISCITGLGSVLLSRCLHIQMVQAPPGSPKPKRRVDADPEVWQGLRDDLHAIALEYGRTWFDLSQRTDIGDGFSNRNFQLWQPILSLASWVEEDGAMGLLDLVRRHALSRVAESKEDLTPEPDAVALGVLTEELAQGREPIAEEILTAAKVRDYTTFGKWTARKMSNLLRNYGLKPDKSGKRRPYRVPLERMREIQDQHGIDLGLSGEGYTPAGTVPCVPCVPAGASGVSGGMAAAEA